MFREARRFWSKIRERKDHNKNAEWINNMETEKRMFEERVQVNMHLDGLRAIFKKMANWKTHDLDDIHGFWFLKFTTIHDRMATEMNKCIQKTEIPEWMTKGKTTLIQKDSLRRTVQTNYRPITCLPTMWKILTEKIRELIYNLLISRGFFPDEQRMPQGNQRYTGTIKYRSTYPQRK